LGWATWGVKRKKPEHKNLCQIKTAEAGVIVFSSGSSPPPFLIW
jgi:hypothetical protein